MRPMSNQEAVEHLVSTPPSVSNTADVLPPRTIMRRNRSEAWNHFTPRSDKRARCNYCSSLIKYDKGTSAMRSHLKRCKENPDKDGNKRQKSVSSSTATSKGHVGSPPSCAKFDQEACWSELVKMFIVAELPISLVENEAFRKFVSVLQPRFSISSRTTLARDILMLWDTKKTNLKKFLSQHCQRVCLTIDTWTSCHNMIYVCLTAHFVDNSWKLHKKILNFCPVANHSGEVIAKIVESCLNGWGLSRVFCLTVDNASSNDVGIQYLKKMLVSQNSLVLKGDYFHLRCCAHILNIIVKEGLKEIGDSIFRISAALKYIRSSPSRLSRFKACVEQEDIEYESLVCLDIETKWNLTYQMLEAALKDQKEFEELELQDKKYVRELEKGKGVPTCKDWDHARLILPFLKIFYEATLRIYGTSDVTSNIYMLEVFGIGKRIRQMCNSRDANVSIIAEKMMKKYDKYWGSSDALNMLLLIAVVFDPRYKMGYVNWMINQIFDFGEAANLKKKLESCLKSLFKEYNDGKEGPQSNSLEARFDEESNEDPYGWNQFLQSTGRKSCDKSELNKYLEEDLETSQNFDILNWWQINSSRFPILANIAREVLAIPVSTVFSKFAYSTGEKVLDPYRSSLTPKMVEALVCTQDWLNGTSFSLLSNEDFEKLEKFQQEMTSQQDVACSAS